MSAFALIQDKRGNTLLIKPRNARKWAEKWLPNVKLMNADRLKTFKNGWTFPASYIREGETPEVTLHRIVGEQLGVRSYHIARQKLYNFYDPSYMFPGKMHWDYCFVFKISIPSQSIKSQWVSTAKFVDVSKLAMSDFSSAQGELAQTLRLL